MNRNSFKSNWHEAKRLFAGMWNTDHTAPHALNSQPIYLIGNRLEVQNLFTPATHFVRVAALVATAMKPENRKEALKQQTEALSTWEDEGGAVPLQKRSRKPAHNVTPK